jgi:hypothetical protein
MSMCNCVCRRQSIGGLCLMALLLSTVSTQKTFGQQPAAKPDVQSPSDVAAQDVAAQIKQLNDAISRTQAQLEESQKQLEQMRQQLNALQQVVAQSGTQSGSTGVTTAAATPDTAGKKDEAAAKTPTLDEVAEQQAMQASQLATHEQSKVESASRYPVRVSGLLLFNAFVNTGGVDVNASPTVAMPGNGVTGMSVSQTVLGLDATGPHLYGARSFADVRIDFFGNSGTTSSTSTFSGYYSTGSLVRLRTMHAGVQWADTGVRVELDRPIISPDAPTSLTAVAQPALAWAGDLWTWNPQVVLAHDFHLNQQRALRFEAALMDVTDAPYSSAQYAIPSGTASNSNERSRWPAVQAHISLLGKQDQYGRNHLGIGGYFAEHHTTVNRDFDSWAATLDYRIAIGPHVEFSTSAYRGLGLGGLGGGAYKDFLYEYYATSGHTFFHALDDVGGWAQLKERVNQRLEFNQAFGVDNAFTGQVRRYYVDNTNVYANLVRNQIFTGNVIYSPSNSLQFSFEYRHMNSFVDVGAGNTTNVIGLAAGYKF